MKSIYFASRDRTRYRKCSITRFYPGLASENFHLNTLVGSSVSMWLKVITSVLKIGANPMIEWENFQDRVKFFNTFYLQRPTSWNNFDHGYHRCTPSARSSSSRTQNHNTGRRKISNKNSTHDQLQLCPIHQLQEALQLKGVSIKLAPVRIRT